MFPWDASMIQSLISLSLSSKDKSTYLFLIRNIYNNSNYNTTPEIK